MRNVPVGSQSLDVSKTGYVSVTTDLFTVVAGTNSIPDINLQKVGGTITGSVTDALDGHALAGATVVVNWVTPTVSTTTNADGSFSLANVPPGDRTVNVSRSDYVPLDSGTLNVVSGKTTNAGVFRLTPRIVLTATALSPFVVKLAWDDPDPAGLAGWLYRGTAPDYLSSLPRPDKGQEVYFDSTVQAGTTYYYRLDKYVGSLYSQSEVMRVDVPATADTTLSLLPTVTTVWPDGFTSLHDSRATVTITLQPEDPAADLTGATVELFIDEGATDAGSALGEFTKEPLYGRDDLACLVRSPQPDQTLTVTDPLHIEFVVPGLTQAQHAFRIRVRDGMGVTRERAFLYQVNRPDGKFSKLWYVGSGQRFKSARPRLFGYGPASRLSPDCQDGDPAYYAFLEVERKEGTTTYLIHYKIETGSDGFWVFVPPEDLPLESAAGGGQQIRFKLLSGVFSANTVTTGRAFPLAGGGTLDLRQSSDAFGTLGESTYTYSTVTVPYEPGGGEVAPQIDPATVTPTIVVPDTDPVVPVRLRFRVLDDDQDLDLSSVRVTNLTLQGAPQVAWMGKSQVGSAPPTDSWAWWEADVPMQGGSNQVLIEARDLGGRATAQTFTVTRTVPNVVARIAAPSPGPYRRHAVVPLDATTSEGPAGMEVRWAFFGRTWNGSTIIRSALPSMERRDAVGSFLMPTADSGVVVRLVVATPGNLPANLYTSDLPCSIYSGTPNCDSTEITLTNACCPSVLYPCYGDWSTQFTVQMLAPASGATLPFNRPLHLSAQVSGPSAEYVFRWWIAPASALSERLLLSPQTPDSTGFAADNAELDVDPIALGLSPGDYEITVEAGIDKAGCVGLIRSASRVVRLGHELSGVAPGQALAGGTVRVYGSTFVPGAAVTILVDPTPLDAADRRTFSLTADEERAVSLQLPADLAPGLTYLAASDPAGNGISVWKQALEVVAPAATVANEEDPSCGGAGTECAHPIAFGQAITANWGEAGDIDTFYLTMGEGTRLNVSVERLDSSLPALHPDAVDPEVFLVDPDGIVDGERGYANDAGADDTNARITGYVAPKSGLYLLACRSLKGAGNYRVTLAKTATRPPADFETVPYGSRAINIIPAAGEASTATFQAMVFDRHGEPVAGATPDWQLVSGSVASTAVSISAPSGIAQATVTLDEGGAAGLTPVFLWPYQPPESAQQTVAREPSHGNEPRPIGAIAGRVTIDPEHLAVTHARLLSPEAIGRMRAASMRERAVRGKVARDGGLGIRAQGGIACQDALIGVQQARVVALPVGAVSIESLSVELLDQGEGALADPLEGLTVRERTPLAVRLIAHCRDAGGTPFNASVPGASATLSVSGFTGYAGGIVTDGEAVCPTATVGLDAESAAFTYEVGRLAVLSHVDEAGDANYTRTEVLAARSAIKVKVAGGWVVLSALHDVEVAPEAGSPDGFLWLEPQDLVGTAGELELWDDTHTVWPTDVWHRFILGPRFVLVDTFGNISPLWGRHDSPYHTEPGSDQVYVLDAGSWGHPPWAGIEYLPARGPAVYNPLVLVEVTKAMIGDLVTSVEGTVSKQVCLKRPGGTLVCDTFSVTNSPSLNLVRINGPWTRDYPLSIGAAWDFGCFLGCPIGSTECDATEYVSVADYLDPASWRTGPGRPLTFARSGKPVLFRLDPVSQEESWFANHYCGGPYQHQQVFMDVPVRAWVNGPLTAPDQVRLTRRLPEEPFELSRAENVELCSGTLVRGPLGSTDEPLSGSCDTLSQNEITLAVSTDPKEFLDGPNRQEGDVLGQVVGISKAPPEPGYYSLVVETSDPRFCQPGQRCRWFAKSFAVVGGWFLDEQYVPLPDFAPIDTATKLYVRVLYEDVGPTLPAVIESIQLDTPYDSLDLDLTRISTSSLTGLSQYEAAFMAVPPTYDGDVNALPLPVLFVPSLEFRFEAKRRVATLARAAAAMAGEPGETLADASAAGRYRIVFTDLAQAPGEPSRRLLVSNCPDQNPGCVGMPLLDDQQFFDADSGRPGLRFDLGIESANGLRPGVDPKNVDLVIEVIDPESEAWYDDEDPDENSREDNLELLDAPGSPPEPGWVPTYEVVQESASPCGNGITLARDDRIGHRFYVGGCPADQGSRYQVRLS